MGEKWDHMKEGATEKYDSIKETVKDKYNELKGDAGHFCDEAFSQRKSFLETTKNDAKHNAECANDKCKEKVYLQLLKNSNP